MAAVADGRCQDGGSWENGTSVSTPPLASPTGTVGQAGRFLVVGVLATAVDVGLFNVFHVLAAIGPVLAKALSTVSSAGVAFLGNRQWSFPGGQEGALPRQVGRFAVVNGIGLLLALAPIVVTKSLLGLDGVVAMNVAANVVGLGLATCFRFYAYRRWVFPAEPAEPYVSAASA
jgi:putative flippase GtrA